MSKIYEEYGLEVENESAASSLAPQKKEPARPKKQRSSLPGKILALFLGIIIGVGGCAGAAYYILSNPSKDVINLIGSMAGFTYEDKVKDKLLANEYGEKSVLELGSVLADAFDKKNLGAFAQISPALNDAIGSMVDKMNNEFGIELDKEGLNATQFTNLPTYFGDALRVAPLGKIISATSQNQELDPFLMEFCYGEEGVNYVVNEDGEVEMLGTAQAATMSNLGNSPTDLINRVALASAIVPKDKAMLSLCYGSENTTYVILRDELGDPIKDERGAIQVEMQPRWYTKNENDKFVDYNGNEVNGTEKGTESGYVIFEIAPVATSGNAESIYLKADGTCKYFAYTAIGETPTPALFKPTLIGQLSKDASSLIDNIVLKDVLGDSVDENKILKHVADKKIKELSGAVTNLTIGQLFEDEIYEEDGTTIRGTWKYLLKTGKDEDGNPIYKTDYKVSSDMNKLLDNMTKNMHDATLQELRDDKILSLDESMLTSTVVGNVGPIALELPEGMVGTKLGTMTTEQILTYTSVLIAAVNANNTMVPIS